MEIFDAFELSAVTEYIPDAFEGEVTSPKTEECLEYLAEGLLGSLKTTRSAKEKKEMIKEYISIAICSGMLISSRRMLYDGMLLRDNTSGPAN